VRADPSCDGGQEGTTTSSGRDCLPTGKLDGLGSVLRSFFDRRPRDAAPNPHVDLRVGQEKNQWLERDIYFSTEGLVPG
jgi:hypothetical protein